MKYLVTGGAGFIGSHLVEMLLAENHECIVVDDLSNGHKQNLPEHRSLLFVPSRIQDIPDADLGSVEGVFHLAAQASVPISIENFYSSSANNLQAMLRVFDIGKHRKIPVVYASSSAVYGNLPVGDDETDQYEILSPYALDKLSQEQYAKLCFHLYSISSAGLRFFNVYGPRQDPENPYSGVISVFMERFMKKKEVLINGGYQTRDFVFVNDVVSVMIKSMQYLSRNTTCEFINVGTGVSVSVDKLYEKLSGIFGYKPRIDRRELPQGDPERSEGTFARLARLLGVKLDEFIQIDEGLRRTVKYFQEVADAKV